MLKQPVVVAKRAENVETDERLNVVPVVDAEQHGSAPARKRLQYPRELIAN